MTRRQIARKLIDTEARITLLKKQLKNAEERAEDLAIALEKPIVKTETVPIKILGSRSALG